MTKAFRCIALAVGICALQAQSIQADIEELGRIGLYPTKLWNSVPGTAMLNDSGLSGVLLRATRKHSDRTGRQVHHRGPGRGRPPKTTTTDSTQVDSGGVGAGKRLLKRTALGTAMAIAARSIFLGKARAEGAYIGIHASSTTYGALFGWPVGVYLADPWESSLWMTAVGHGVAWRLGRNTPGSLWGILGWTIMVSEASRSAPKGIRKPLQWLFGKLRKPDARVSFGLVPEPQRGLSARASLRF